MSTESNSSGGGSLAPVMVEDVFLTDDFLIKGRLANKVHRLTKMLEDSGRQFLAIEDAVMVSLRGNNEVVRTPRVLVNTDRVVFAHELVDVAGDHQARVLASNEKSTRVRAFYSGAVQIELAGHIEPGAYEPGHGPTRKFFVLQEPKIRGLKLDSNPELNVLSKLSYAIVQKSKLAYVYDFS